MVVNNGDFVEIEFTGRLKESGKVFDSIIKADVEKAGLNIKDVSPFVFCVGQEMLPKGFDLDIEGKEVGKSYSVEIEPENAFGVRNPKLVKMIPTKLFNEQKINPQRGMQLILDGQPAMVLSNSGGRAMVDFNNPMAGKDVVYEYKILRKVTDDNEKVKGFCKFFFRAVFDFKIDGDTIKFNVPKQAEPYIKAFARQFENTIGKKVAVEVKAPEASNRVENKE
jgi:FKBP-type peptidyl-prolyl cis-trans isomerase SlyD